MHFLPSWSVKQHFWGNRWGYELSTEQSYSPRLWCIDRNNNIYQRKSEAIESLGRGKYFFNMITGTTWTFSLTYATTHAHIFHLTAKSDNFAKKCILFVDFFFFDFEKLSMPKKTLGTKNIPPFWCVNCIICISS